MKRHRHPPSTLPTAQALQRMRTGSVLVHMHARSGRTWFVVPGGEVTDQAASEIRGPPSVVAQEDGLFPQHGQTWRMRTFAHA
jgi:hypothetical protein